MARGGAPCHDFPMQRARLTFSQTLALAPASKLFQVLVVGGLSLAATEACSSASSVGDDSGAPADAAVRDATDGSALDTGATEDVTTRGDVAPQDARGSDSGSDSASTEDGMTDSSIPFDARVDFPNEAGFCAHGCALVSPGERVDRNFDPVHAESNGASVTDIARASASCEGGVGNRACDGG